MTDAPAELRFGHSEKRRYDIPLNRGSGTGFVMLLIALMTFLAVMAMASSFALSALTDRWTSGLENRVTVEIPARADTGAVRTRAEVRDATRRIETLLKAEPSVAAAHGLTDREIADLVRPWLGGDISLDDIPLPGLISVELAPGRAADTKALEGRIRATVPGARLDAHEAWLSDVLRFARALQLAALLITIVIGFTAATSIAGAVRARLAVHSADVELLHLMGASDSYIAGQFQRHSMILALKGGIAGTVAGALALLVIQTGAGKLEVNLLPGFHLSPIQMAAIAVMPVFAAALAILATRLTVLRALGRMP